MASDPFLSWANRTVLRAAREVPYLSIQDVVVFVRDLDVSKRFYVQQLGIRAIACFKHYLRVSRSRYGLEIMEAHVRDF